MDFKFTSEQQLMRQMFRDFVEKEVKPLALQIEEQKRVPDKLIKEAAKLGLLGVKFPEEYGGGGAGEAGYSILCEELGRGSASFTAIIGAHQSIGATAIYLAGSEEQKKKYLVPLAQGKLLACYALSEPNAGSDAANIETTAVRDGNEWIINGSKIWITSGDRADIITLYAVTDKNLRARGGITAFIIEKGYKGLRVGKSDEKMGLHGVASIELSFEDMRVPNENVLGAVGDGFKIAMATLDRGRLSLGASCLGAAKEVLEMSINYATKRIAFGKPISEFEAIQFMFADMGADTYAMESMVYRTAWMADERIPFSRESAIVKMFCSEKSEDVIDKALQIYGGYGYMREYQIERFYRDSRVNRIFEGTNEIQRLVIAKDLLKKGRY